MKLGFGSPGAWLPLLLGFSGVDQHSLLLMGPAPSLVPLNPCGPAHLLASGPPLPELSSTARERDPSLPHRRFSSFVRTLSMFSEERVLAHHDGQPRV